MKVPTLVAVAPLLAATALAPAPAQSPAPTTDVSVRVNHADGRPASDTAVRLQVHDGHEIVFDEQARTDAAGRARWRGVPAGESARARAAVRTDDAVTYYSDTVALEPGVDAALEVTLYPVTDEGRPLHLDTLHLIVQIDDPGLYRVLQFMTVSNAGQAAYAGGPALRDGRRAGLVLPLPPGAGSVRVAPFPSAEEALPPEAAEIRSDRVLDARPVPPAGRQVAITYDLVSEGEPVEVVLELPYPTQSVSLLVGGDAAGQVDLRTDSLEPQPDQQIGERSYRMWLAEALAPGTRVRFTIGPHRGGLTIAHWALLALGVGLLCAVAAGLQRPAPGHVERRRDEIIAAIAALDDAYEEGELEDSEYFGRRAAELERLELLARIGGAAATDRGSAARDGATAAGKRGRRRRRSRS